jgi:hypothetical protein
MIDRNITEDSEFIATVRGFDETLSQVVHGRQAYALQDVKWWHHLEDIFSRGDDGFLNIDFSKFDAVSPDA